MWKLKNSMSHALVGRLKIPAATATSAAFGLQDPLQHAQGPNALGVIQLHLGWNHFQGHVDEGIASNQEEHTYRQKPHLEQPTP